MVVFEICLVTFTKILDIIAYISKMYDQHVNSWTMCINEMKLETLNINAYKKNS